MSDSDDVVDRVLGALHLDRDDLAPATLQALTEQLHRPDPVELDPAALAAKVPRPGRPSPARAATTDDVDLTNEMDPARLAEAVAKRNGGWW